MRNRSVLSYDRARALRARGAMLPPGLSPPGEILDSWSRCLDLGLDFAARLRLPVAEAAELAQRRERAAAVRRLARAELETLMQQIAGSNYLLAFADADGVVLDVVADNRFAMNADEDIVAGSCWREDVAGTNGLGTALADGRAIAVSGADHYFLRLADISCTASPIRDADGRIVGLLDASSYVQERQRHTLALVQMSTAHIENMLLAEQCAGDLLIAIHPRREFLRTLSAGVLAFDPAGTLRASNARAQALLSGLEVRRGAPFERLFGERFEAFVSRLHAQGETRLHDEMGSTLVARSIGQRLPPVAPALDTSRPAVAPAPPYATDDARAAQALRLATLALQQGCALRVEGERGSGKKRLVREALRAARGAVDLTTLAADGLDAGRLDAALARIGAGMALLLDHVEHLGASEQQRLRRWLDARHERGEPAALAVTLAASGDALLPELHHRLGAAVARVPALRERSDLADCARLALSLASPKAHLDRLALPAITAHPWPGNWRELEAAMSRAALASAAAAAHPQAPLLIGIEHLHELVPPAPAAHAASVLQQEATARVLTELARQGGSIAAAARRLGVSRNTVYRHLREARQRGGP